MKGIDITKINTKEKNKNKILLLIPDNLIDEKYFLSIIAKIPIKYKLFVKTHPMSSFTISKHPLLNRANLINNWSKKK